MAICKQKQRENKRARYGNHREVCVCVRVVGVVCVYTICFINVRIYVRVCVSLLYIHICMHTSYTIVYMCTSHISYFIYELGRLQNGGLNNWRLGHQTGARLWFGH